MIVYNNTNNKDIACIEYSADSRTGQVGAYYLADPVSGEIVTASEFVKDFNTGMPIRVNIEDDGEVYFPFCCLKPLAPGDYAAVVSFDSEGSMVTFYTSEYQPDPGVS